MNVDMKELIEILDQEIDRHFLNDDNKKDKEKFDNYSLEDRMKIMYDSLSRYKNFDREINRVKNNYHLVTLFELSYLYMEKIRREHCDN